MALFSWYVSRRRRSSNVEEEVCGCGREHDVVVAGVAVDVGLVVGSRRGWSSRGRGWIIAFAMYVSKGNKKRKITEKVLHVGGSSSCRPLFYGSLNKVSSWSILLLVAKWWFTVWGYSILHVINAIISERRGNGQWRKGVWPIMLLNLVHLFASADFLLPPENLTKAAFILTPVSTTNRRLDREWCCCCFSCRSRRITWHNWISWECLLGKRGLICRADRGRGHHKLEKLDLLLLILTNAIKDVDHLAHQLDDVKGLARPRVNIAAAADGSRSLPSYGIVYWRAVF